MSKSLQVHSLYNIVEMLRDYEASFDFHVTDKDGEKSIIPSYGNWCLEDMVKRFDKIEIVVDMGKMYVDSKTYEQQIADILSEEYDWREIKKVSIKDRGLSYTVEIFLGHHNPSLYRYGNVLTLEDNETVTIDIFRTTSYSVDDVHKLEKLTSRISDVVNKLRKEETSNGTTS